MLHPRRLNHHKQHCDVSIAHLILTLHFKPTNKHIAMWETNFVSLWNWGNFIHLHYQNTVECLSCMAWVLFCNWHKRQYLQSAYCHQHFPKCLLKMPAAYSFVSLVSVHHNTECHLSDYCKYLTCQYRRLSQNMSDQTTGRLFSLFAALWSNVML
jgi:hypothetical protein